ncbi:MAG: SDR family oxidoreductase [Bacteroidia bacterium]
MRLLITGARGLVGYHVAQLAESRGFLPILSGRGSNPMPQYPYFNADLTEAAAVYELIRQAQPDVVIHSAAMTQVDACQAQPLVCWQNNVLATRLLLQALAELFPKAHFIFISTDFVYDGFPMVRRPYIEGDYEAPLSVYGASKLAAEAWVKLYPGFWTIVRTTQVYGWTPSLVRDNILLRVLSKLKNHQPIQMHSDQIRRPTWAGDLAEGLLLLARLRAQGIYHLAGQDILTPYQFSCQAAEIWGLPTSLIEPVTQEKLQLPAPRPLYSPLSIEKAQALGYQPHPTEEILKTLRQTIPL